MVSFDYGFFSHVVVSKEAVMKDISESEMLAFMRVTDSIHRSMDRLEDAGLWPQPEQTSGRVASKVPPAVPEDPIHDGGNHIF